MKKVLALLMVLLLGCSFALAHAEGITVSAPGTKSEALSSLSVSWKPCGDYFMFIAEWRQNGDQWEACLTGLPERLSDAQVRLLLCAAVQGQRAVVTGGGLIDAEKATNKLPISYADKLVKDEISEQSEWGDSLHCWAASVADMMELTGWRKAAVEPDTGRGFANEDDLFGFFNRVFINEGAFQAAALEWAFTGNVTEYMARSREDMPGTMLPETAGRTWSELKSNDFETAADAEAYMSQLCRMFTLLKDGVALGGDIDIYGIDYPLKSDPQKLCSYSSELQTFVNYQMVTVPQDKVVDALFVPSAENGLPIIVEQDTETDTYYEKESGKPVDKNEIWRAKLIYDDVEDAWFPADGNGGGEDEASYFRLARYPVDALDFDHPKQNARLGGGAHAVTVMGYVMNLSEKAPASRIKAVILADSDNDATIFRPNPNTPLRENRPNTYTMYPTEKITVPLILEDGETISLNGYLPYTQIPLTCVSSLKPAPEQPQPPQPIPQTGDTFPVPLYVAALLATSCALLLLCRRSRR